MRFRWRWGVTERDLDDEIQAHLALETEQRIEEGEAPEDAARSARRAFGSVAFFKDETRALLIACANLAGLLLVRNSARSREALR